MYKVMVIDDEEVIVKGLCSLVPWAKYDCAVVATAANGREALPIVAAHRPDIILTDINMPEMDGLSMVAALRSQYPSLRISILTGHPVFEYAKRAIEMGVSFYMLKPSKLDELEAALAAMVGELKEIEEYQANRGGADRQHGGDSRPDKAAGGPPGSSPTQPDEADDAVLPDAMGAELEATQNFVIKNALIFMEEHYNEKISLQDVAEHVFVSQWHLSKLIARNTSQNFSDILNGIRIRKAKELLKNPALRIWEISESVGFGDVSHFSRIFKKHEKISANEYRNNLTIPRKPST